MSKGQIIKIDLKLSLSKQKQLDAYLNGLHCSLNWLIRELVHKELALETIKYEKSCEIKDDYQGVAE